MRNFWENVQNATHRLVTLLYENSRAISFFLQLIVIYTIATNDKISAIILLTSSILFGIIASVRDAEASAPFTILKRCRRLTKKSGNAVFVERGREAEAAAILYDIEESLKK